MCFVFGRYICILESPMQWGDVQGPRDHLHFVWWDPCGSHCALCNFCHLCHCTLLHPHGCYNHCFRHHSYYPCVGGSAHWLGHECYDGDPFVQGDPSVATDSPPLFSHRILPYQPDLLRGPGHLAVGHEAGACCLPRMCGGHWGSQCPSDNLHKHGTFRPPDCFHLACMQARDGNIIELVVLLHLLVAGFASHPILKNWSRYSKAFCNVKSRQVASIPGNQIFGHSGWTP